MSKYKASSGWIINPRRLKDDDRSFLQTLDLAGEQSRQEFIDECIDLYLRAWKIDIVDYEASMKGRS